jgi:preprotein translocase subunit SecG
MYTFLMILFILISFAMVVVILLQAGKGQGLAGSIGGGMAGGAIFGGRGAADFLSKVTTWVAALYIVFAILIGMIYKSEAENVQKSLIQKRMEEQQNLPAPNIPLAPIEGENQRQPEE